MSVKMKGIEVSENIEIDERLDEIINESLVSVNKILKNKADQFLIIGMDESILSLVIDRMKENTNFKHVIVSNKDPYPTNKIFYIQLKNNNLLEYQSLLYYYLELPNVYNCFVCLISTCSNCLSFFEKRIRSRFNNRIIFVRNLELNDSFRYSLQSSMNQELMKKYSFPKYSCHGIYSLLTPIHLILINISYESGINIGDCYFQYLKSVRDIPEVKKAASFTIINSVQDLLGFGIINSSGRFAWEYNEFKDYLKSNGPLYLKRLLNTKFK